MFVLSHRVILSAFPYPVVGTVTGILPEIVSLYLSVNTGGSCEFSLWPQEGTLPMFPVAFKRQAINIPKSQVSTNN